MFPAKDRLNICFAHGAYQMAARFAARNTGIAHFQAWKPEEMVARILLLPFAVAVYALLVVVAALGGFLAVAHAMGETYTRRRMAMGTLIGSANSYRYLVVGLGALAALWLAWSVFGWVPVAGDIIRGLAFLVTWLLATAGFGAALLSRAGIRENFAGRLIPPEALTDEYLWATPQFGVPAGRRPGGRTPTQGL
jgi:hypothetical protein